jgi:hypothetical protein
MGLEAKTSSFVIQYLAEDLLIIDSLTGNVIITNNLKVTNQLKIGLTGSLLVNGIT